jgi:hypothetical protein
MYRLGSLSLRLLARCLAVRLQPGLQPSYYGQFMRFGRPLYGDREPRRRADFGEGEATLFEFRNGKGGSFV